MDEQNKYQEEKKTMTDAEVLAAVKGRLPKVHTKLGFRRLPLVWRILFTFVILANLIPLGFFFLLVSAAVYPSSASLYLVFLTGYMVNIAVAVLIVTVLTITLFIFIQKPRGKVLDLSIRIIYITIIVYLLPTLLFVFRNFYN